LAIFIREADEICGAVEQYNYVSVSVSVFVNDFFFLRLKPAIMS